MTAPMIPPHSPEASLAVGGGDARRGKAEALRARVNALRGMAAAKFADAAKIRDSVNSDHAFWTQPAYANSAGRAFSRQRDRERVKLQRAAQIAAEGESLSKKADRLEAAGPIMAGDATAAREAVISSCNVSVGQLVDTTFYGTRRVLKVNRKTVVVEGPVNVGKEFIRAVSP